MRIGITERGDASIDLSWMTKLSDIDGVILITKNITDKFISAVLSANIIRPVIVHCTCTGWGGSDLEPHVPDYEIQLSNLKKLIDKGFPSDHCVLRLDPIIPSIEGLYNTQNVLYKFTSLNLGINRVRVSIVDIYKHVKSRCADNINYLDDDQLYPKGIRIRKVAELLSEFSYEFETCAEPELAKYGFTERGCISYEDLRIMGLQDTCAMYENPQGRSGCHCLSCKTELLENKYRCPHGCMYCYWYDKS